MYSLFIDDELICSSTSLDHLIGIVESITPGMCDHVHASTGKIVYEAYGPEVELHGRTFVEWIAQIIYAPQV